MDLFRFWQWFLKVRTGSSFNSGLAFEFYIVNESGTAIKIRRVKLSNFLSRSSSFDIVISASFPLQKPKRTTKINKLKHIKCQVLWSVARWSNGAHRAGSLLTESSVRASRNDANVRAEEYSLLGKCPGGANCDFLFHFLDHWHHHHMESAPSTVHGTDFFVFWVQHCHPGHVQLAS